MLCCLRCLSIKCPGAIKFTFKNHCPGGRRKQTFGILQMQKYVGSLSGTPSVSRPSTFEGSELLLSCLIRLSCILLVSRKKKVWEEDGIPKGLRDYQRWLYNARGSVVLETRTGEWAGGSELGEVKRREENQLFLSLRPIAILQTLMFRKGFSILKAALWTIRSLFFCSSQLSEII